MSEIPTFAKQRRNPKILSSTNIGTDWCQHMKPPNGCRSCDTLKYVATIKHCHSPIIGSLPKKNECLHYGSMFLCGLCSTTKSSMPDYSVRTDSSANLPLSWNATSETHSASLTQSLVGLSLHSPDETKSNGLHSQHDQK